VATRRESDSKPRDTRHKIERENLEDEEEMQIFDEEKKMAIKNRLSAKK
jgi:hypothetical protein